MRRTAVWTATSGRDAGKQFKITEAPADQAEDWCARAGLALARGGLDLPPDVFSAGAAGLGVILPYVIVAGVRALAGVKHEEIKPLLAELMSCVRFLPPGTNGMTVSILPGDGSQIEEVRTRWQLQQQVLELHLGFSVADTLQSLTQSQAESA